jgi:hypothetical protein
MGGALTALFYKLPALARNRSDPALHALCSYFLLSFLSFFLGLDAIWPHIADAFGYRNITTIIIHCIIVLMTAAQQVALVYWSYPPELARPKAQRRLAAFGIVLAILIVMFYWALPSERHGTAETASLLNMHNPRYVSYLFLYLATVATGQMLTMNLSLRYAKIATRPWLRRGMRAVAAGAVFILIYCTVRYMEIIGVQLGADMSSWDPVQWITGDVGSLLELIGWTIPGWGPSLSAGRRWLGDYHAHRRLYPLWHALYGAVPATTTNPPRSHLTALPLQRRLSGLAYRRVVEILDGLRELQIHFNPADSDRARQQAQVAGLTGEHLHLAAYAIQLHAALAARASNQPTSDHPPGTLIHPQAEEISTTTDLSGETKWLIQLAKAFTDWAPTAENSIRSKKPSRRTSGHE